jgi:hypothetical protein
MSYLRNELGKWVCFFKIGSLADLATLKEVMGMGLKTHLFSVVTADLSDSLGI